MMVDVWLHFFRLLKNSMKLAVCSYFGVFHHFMKPFPSLPGLPSIFPFIIMTNQRLFQIVYPIHTLFLDFSAFHIDL